MRNAALASLHKALHFCSRPLVYQFLVIVLIDVLVNLRLLFDFNSYVGFGNFLLPYTLSQYSGPPGPWSPLQYLGTPNVNVFLSDVNYTFVLGPLTVLSTALGPIAGAKLYILGSIAFLGLASLLFIRTLVRHPLGQLISVSFLLIGPFQLQLYAQGDYTIFVSASFVSLSLYFLKRAVDDARRRWVWFPTSLWMLTFSVLVLQFFLLGTILYLACTVIFVYHAQRGNKVLRKATAKLARLVALPFLLAPLLLTALYGSISLSPGSALAQPLSSFTANSAGPLQVLFLQGYVHSPGPYLGFALLESTNQVLANAWTTLTVSLVIAIWIGYAFTSDSRVLFFLCLAAFASVAGSGPYGPLGAMNVYLYVHLPSYQTLNASYYWDAALIVPCYAISLGLLLEQWVEALNARKEKSRAAAKGTRAPRLSLRVLVSRARRLPALRVWGALLIVLVIVVAVIPYGTDSQYQSTYGMHQIVYPSDYSQLGLIIPKLVGSSDAGIALFNPDVNWLINNTSVQNTFFLFPFARTPGLPFYGAPPVASNYYVYWIYDEFYSNSTRYVGELLATVGVEYLLVFYNTQSASFYPYFLQFTYGENASLLLRYQVGIVPVYHAKDFAIYRNLFFDGVGAAVDSLSVVAGDYNELNAIAYAGVNLTNQALVFTTDMSPSTCGNELSRVARIYAASGNALLSLALECNYMATANPLSDTFAGTSGWLSSYQDGDFEQPVVESWPTQLTTSSGGPNTISIPVSTGGCGGDCSLWLPVSFSGEGGLLTFQWGSEAYTVNTTKGFGDYNNSMIWIELPFLISSASSGVLKVTSHNGWNSVGTLLVMNDTFSSLGTIQAWLNETLASKSVVYVTPGEALNLVGSTSGPVSSAYYQTTSSENPGLSGLSLEALGNKPLAPVDLQFLSPPQSGWLTLLVRAIATSVLEVSYGTTSQVVGFDTGKYNGSYLNWSTIRLFLDASDNATGSSVQIQLLNGSAGVAQVAFFPESTAPNVSNTIPDVDLRITNVYYTPGISNVSVSVSPNNSSGTSVNGSFSIQPASNQPVLAIYFNQSVSRQTDLEASFTATPGLKFYLSGLIFGDGNQGTALYSSSMYCPIDLVYCSNYTLIVSGLSPKLQGPVHFSVAIITVSVDSVLAVSDVNSTVSIAVTSDSSGYKVISSEPSSLILVRIPYFTSMSASSTSVSLNPGLGSVVTLLSNPDGLRDISVGPTANGYLEIGIALALSTTAIWIAAEMFLYVRSRRSSIERAGRGVRASKRQGP